LAGIVLENILAAMKAEGAFRMWDAVLSVCVSVRLWLRARVSRFASLSMPASARCGKYTAVVFQVNRNISPEFVRRPAVSVVNFSLFIIVLYAVGRAAKLWWLTRRLHLTVIDRG
jgi:hypothetical protein